LLLQAAIDREVAAFLGRERYERAASCQNPRPGMRNGHCPTTVKTTAGPVVVQRPKLRGTTERWRRLDEVKLDYLFLDDSHFKYHDDVATEPVLAAWGIDTDGKPVFVRLEAAASESGDA
jgi:transposase-like protein